MRDEMLADPAARAEYERLAPRYELISAIIGARKVRGWTQTDLAEACGASQSAIARLESGDHDPKWSTAIRACRALGLQVTINEQSTKLAG
ncbi:MAG: helix-turn-helix transcriptional regulator [Thermoleophilia bacterium]|nr:helix-turn-helix transcriptional regulator [Thermoleophilia bacterium]